MSFNTIFSKPCSSLWDQMQWRPKDEQLTQFIKLQVLLKEWNKEINLTRLVDGSDYWITQIFDSLWPFKDALNNPKTTLNCVDVGSGCGLPGLALAIALPKSNVTLIESITRKTTALENISKELDLSRRITIRNERAETSGHQTQLRGSFDLALARAVSSAPVVAEYLVPLLKREGQAMIYRGKYLNSDQKALNKALSLLKAKIKTIQNIKLPADKGERNVITIIPTEICPNKYPRDIGIPAKRPLGT